MREELIDLAEAIEAESLPSTFHSLFSRIWDNRTQSFHAQENTLLDFKETFPHHYTDSYGIGIVRCALASVALLYLGYWIEILRLLEYRVRLT